MIKKAEIKYWILLVWFLGVGTVVKAVEPQ